MIAKLFLAFTIIPLIELLLLIPLGQQIGVIPTIAIVVLTGAVGAWLGKRQGLAAWKAIKDDLASGQLPGDSLLDGLLILIACTLLITPGVLTDFAGMLFLIPATRAPVRNLARKRFVKMLEKPSFTVVDMSYPGTKNTIEDDVIDITP